MKAEALAWDKEKEEEKAKADAQAKKDEESEKTTKMFNYFLICLFGTMALFLIIMIPLSIKRKIEQQARA